jgi:hypothetical protein
MFGEGIVVDFETERIWVSFGKAKKMFTAKKLPNHRRIPLMTLDFNYATKQVESINDSVNEARIAEYEEEETRHNEILSELRAINENTSCLPTLIEIIHQSNENQEEMLTIIIEILSIAKAKDKKEAKSLYEKTIGKISSTVKDGENLAKLVTYATTAYQLIGTML